MSLLDLIAAAGEEFIGLRALGAGKGSTEQAAIARRARRRLLGATILSLLVLGACWALARLLRESPGASLAAYGVYIALAAALVSALGWAYSWAALGRAAPRRGHARGQAVEALILCGR